MGRIHDKCRKDKWLKQYISMGGGIFICITGFIGVDGAGRTTVTGKNYRGGL